MSDESEYSSIIMNVTLFSNKDEFLDKFLRLVGKPVKFNTASYPPSVIDFYPVNRKKENKDYIIQFWLAKSLYSPEKNWVELYNHGASVVLIHIDENDVNFVSKLRGTIIRFKSNKEAKYVLVYDKRNMNQLVKEMIKFLLEDNTVKGIYGINFNETDYKDKFFDEIIKIYNSHN